MIDFTVKSAAEDVGYGHPFIRTTRYPVSPWLKTPEIEPYPQSVYTCHMTMEFEWDPRKAEHNRKNHGVDFAEAATVFDDPLSITYPDPDHSRYEERFIIIGMSNLGRLLIVAHMDRADATRIISARSVTNRERKLYESDS